MGELLPDRQGGHERQVLSDTAIGKIATTWAMGGQRRHPAVFDMQRHLISRPTFILRPERKSTLPTYADRSPPTRRAQLKH